VEAVGLCAEAANEKAVAADEYRGELVRLERAGFGRFATDDGLRYERFFVPDPSTDRQRDWGLLSINQLI
jgi:hypothetical protein